MGGGFVMIPLMTSVLKLSQHQAHGTSLFAVAATGLSGAISYGDDVRYETAMAVAICGMLSARAGARLTQTMSDRALKRALGVLMLAMAPIVPLKAYFTQQQPTSVEGIQEDEVTSAAQLVSSKPQEASPSTTTSSTTHDTFSPPMHLLLPCGIGLCSGFLAGVFGVGGGVIVVPALTLATSMSHHQALATSLAAMCLPAAVGTYTHAAAGNVAWRVAPVLSLGAFAGAYVGGKLAKHTDEMTLRWGFSGLLAMMGLRTLVKA
jgi:uncharacterized membrane protein YfcA